MRPYGAAPPRRWKLDTKYYTAEVDVTVGTVSGTPTDDAGEGASTVDGESSIPSECSPALPPSTEAIILFFEPQPVRVVQAG